MTPLPVDAALPELQAAVREHGAAVVLAPPGSGKSTRAAPALLEVVDGTVLLLQPRRVAAISLAERIAAERGEVIGDTIGYRVRFERKGGARTRLWVETEGTLTARLQSDPYLDGVGAVVLDEFHERSLHADLALAWIAELRRSVRPDLAVVVMSATLAAEPVAAFLAPAPVVSVDHAPHPVTTSFLPARDRERIGDHLARGVQAALAASDGDVLAFAPGVGEIVAAQQALRGTGVACVPLHGSLSARDQAAALQPGRERRVVLATNVAETSVTVPGVTAVVDSGYARVARFDPGRGLDRLVLERIARSSADQRRGRAGRLGPGTCIRLWSAAEDRRLHQELDPELRRCDLARALLAVVQLHGPELATFPWFQAPEAERVAAAAELLHDLGILDDAGAVSGLGRLVCDLPVHPRLGRLLVAAGSHSALELGVRMAALLDERDVRRRQAAPVDPGPADLLDRLAALDQAELANFDHSLARADIDAQAARRVSQVAAQLRRASKDLGGGDGTAHADDLVPRLVLAAWPDRVGVRSAPDSDRVTLVGGTAASIDRSSALRALPGRKREPLVVAHEVQGFDGKGTKRQVIRQGVVIDRELLAEVAPDSLREVDDLSYDAARDRVVASRALRYRDLTLHYAEQPNPDPAAVAACLAAAMLERSATLIAEHPAAQAWWRRVTWLQNLPEPPALPAVDLAAAITGWCSGKRSRAEVLASDPLPWLQMGWSHADQQQLERLAPTHWTLPGGRSAAIDYSDERPVLAARMQEWFGCSQTPTIADGRVALVLHLLAPNGRPQQVTDDLPGFWQRTWSQVRKDLRGRYPKHAWPEDPLSAPPAGPRGKRR